MKRTVVLFLATLLTCSCGSSNKSSSNPVNPPTPAIPAIPLSGLWTIQFTTPSMPAGYQQTMTVKATLVPGPCSFDVPAGVPDAGTLTVRGPVCYIADLNTAQGASEITAGTLAGMKSAMVVGVPKQAQNRSALEFQLALWNDYDTSIVYVGTGVVSGTAQAPAFSGSWDTPGQTGDGPLPDGTFSASQN